MSRNPGSPARPAAVTVRMARDDAEPAGLPGRRHRAVPLAVDLRGVHKRFGSVQAVRGVALTITSGEVMAFLGPNGAGKTSTIDMILGLSRPDAGAVEVYGMAPRQAVRKGLVSAVMQTGGLLKDLTVAETVQYTAGSAGLCQVHPAVRAQPACPLSAGRRHPAMELDPEPGRVARHFRDRRRLVPAPRHRQGVTQRRSRPGASARLPSAARNNETGLPPAAEDTQNDGAPATRDGPARGSLQRARSAFSARSS